MNNENKPPEQTNNENPEEENLDDTIEEIKQSYRNYSRRLL